MVVEVDGSNPGLAVGCLPEMANLIRCLPGDQATAADAASDLMDGAGRDEVDGHARIEQQGGISHGLPNRLGKVEDLGRTVVSYVSGLGQVGENTPGADDVGMEVAGELGLGDVASGVELRGQQTVMEG